ncbi:Mitochondrial large subunit ribosomal protein (Img2) domain containing protein [Elaphomyces granulatus]
MPHRPSSSPSRSLLPSSHQSRTFFAKLVRPFPASSSQSPSPSSSSSSSSSSSKNSAEDVQSPSPQRPDPPLQLTNLPYFIRRTPSNQLPVYLVTKTGGTKRQTKIQKTEGDLDALRNDLARTLGLESGDPRATKSPEVTINRLNGHIIVKGWRKPEIQKFLLERNF